MLIICFILFIIFNNDSSSYTVGHIVSNKHSPLHFEDMDCNSNLHNTCIVLVKYNVYGYDYTNTFNINTSLMTESINIGDKIKIMYDTDNPNDATIVYDTPNHFSNTIFTILSIIIILILISYIHIKINKYNLLISF